MNLKQDNWEDSSEGFNHTQDSQLEGSLQRLEDDPHNYLDISGASMHPQITGYLECNSSWVFRDYSGWKSLLQARLGRARVDDRVFPGFSVVYNSEKTFKPVFFSPSCYLHWIFGLVIFVLLIQPYQPKKEVGGIFCLVYDGGGGPTPLTLKSLQGLHI